MIIINCVLIQHLTVLNINVPNRYTANESGLQDQKGTMYLRIRYERPHSNAYSVLLNLKVLFFSSLVVQLF